MENDRRRASGDDRFHPFEIDFRLGLIQAVRRANRRRKTVNPRCFDEFDAPVDWNQFTFDVATNFVLNSADGFEFTFNAGAVFFGKGNDFLAQSFSPS